MATTYFLDGSEYFPSGDLNISVFPSGLIKVEQMFVSTKALITNKISDLLSGSEFPEIKGVSTFSRNIGFSYDKAIAYDGLYIFPDPQVKLNPNGFTEAVVTAYGRRNLIGDTSYNYEYFDLSESVGNIQTISQYKVRTKLVQKVIKSDEIDGFLFDLEGIWYPQLIGGIIGSNQNYVFRSGVDGVKFTNYGRFTEVTYTAKYRISEIVTPEPA